MADKDDYQPTPELRWIERDENPEHPTHTRMTRVLQQKWVMPDVKHPLATEWRDVPETTGVSDE